MTLHHHHVPHVATQWYVYGQHLLSSSMAVASTQQEDNCTNSVAHLTVKIQTQKLDETDKFIDKAALVSITDSTGRITYEN